ncbi:tRNA threonylcarbamoyladenosine biosynthesis protein TsaE [Ureibacillus thermosphaericus]|uniref:tRNA threonylcarbamoyladenosine biosynthesis protein TsaE n=2 Tax=Caryophanaceae TaxID=186818 RepID=A0A840PTG1_URETH|nr:tRNA threonylcarbamoyladenosine biosynthesis protein TsaE [Ureibacillus thermosphaericus]
MKTMYEKEVHSLEETNQLGIRLANLLEPGDNLTFEGDLGAGKTTFIQALAKGLGISRTVNSPTFTIMKQYEGKLPLNHLDVYRLENSDEDLGWDEIFYGDAVTVIEWAHLIEENLPDERLDIEIQRIDENKRKFIFRPIGKRYERLCEELFT